VPAFQRALAIGNPTIAWATAAEVGHLSLSDALALCLLLLDADAPRYEPAVVRWHARLCTETRELSVAEAQLALGALQALRSPGAAARR